MLEREDRSGSGLVGLERKEGRALEYSERGFLGFSHLALSPSKVCLCSNRLMRTGLGGQVRESGW